MLSLTFLIKGDIALHSYTHGTTVRKMIEQNLVLKHCAKILIKHDPNFDPESAAFQKQQALDDKMREDERMKERAMYKDDSKKQLKRGGRVLITQNSSLRDAS